MRRTLLHNVIDAILGAGDSDAVTRRIRRSLAGPRHQPAQRPRTAMAELLEVLAGRGSAHSSVRELALRRSRR